MIKILRDFFSREGGKKIFSGALVLSVGALLTKILGACYKIPLTNFLGADGLGLYQLVFPTYAMLLTLSSTGIPGGISKLVAEGKDGVEVLKKAFVLFGVIGAVGSLVMFFGAEFFAKWQGSINAKLGYIALSPSVAIVSCISVLRGYYQGKLNMIPTAISQLIEQAVKFSLGLISVIFLRLDTTLSVAVCLGAVTLSEIFALAFLGVKYVFDVKKLKPSLPKRELSPHLTVSYGDIVRTVFPITFTFLMLPLSRVADSFLVVNIVSRYTENATSLYGLYSGAVESVVGVPVAICYGISVVATPFIAKNKKDFVGKAKLIGATVSFAFLCAVATFLFAKTAVNVLYGGLSEADRETVVALLKISALSVLFLPVLQTTNAILIGEGKPFVASVSMLLGVGAKLAVILLTVVNPQINVAGVAFSDICCYFVATNFNLLYIINDRYFSANKTALRRAKNAVI